MRLGNAGKHLGGNEAGSLLLELPANSACSKISGSRRRRAAGATPPVGTSVRRIVGQFKPRLGRLAVNSDQMLEVWEVCSGLFVLSGSRAAGFPLGLPAALPENRDQSRVDQLPFNANTNHAVDFCRHQTGRPLFSTVLGRSVPPSRRAELAACFPANPFPPSA